MVEDKQEQQANNGTCNEHSENDLLVHSEASRAFRNLTIASVCSFLVLSGYIGLLNLQSTINAEGDLGAMAQSLVYVFATVTSLTLADMSITKFGSKSVQILGTAAYTLYFCGNLYLWSYTLLASSVVLGLAKGVYNPALVYYINEMATRYQASRPTETLEVVLSRFFGIYFFFVGIATTVGNIISSAVLTTGASGQMSSRQTCGIWFDPNEIASNPNLDPPSETARLILFGAYALMGVASVVIIATLLDPLKNDLKNNSGCQAITSRVMSALRHLMNPHQLLLLPLTVFFGMKTIFYTNEFTQAFIACSWGIQNVGFVTVFSAVCFTVTSLLVGVIVKKTSILAALLLAAVASLVTLAFLFVWQPSSETRVVLFMVAGIWGVCEAIWQSQISALYGLIFPDNREAAYANLYVWCQIGVFMSYLYAPHLSVETKIGVLLTFLILGMSGYFISHRSLKRLTSNVIDISSVHENVTGTSVEPASWKTIKENG